MAQTAGDVLGNRKHTDYLCGKSIGIKMPRFVRYRVQGQNLSLKSLRNEEIKRLIKLI